MPEGDTIYRTARALGKALGVSCRLDEHKAQAAADCGCGAFYCVELDFTVLGVEETVEVGAAGSHAASHCGLGEGHVAHGGFYLPGQDALDGVVGGVFGEALFLQEVV
jgi:hypothetical protein